MEKTVKTVNRCCGPNIADGILVHLVYTGCLIRPVFRRYLDDSQRAYPEVLDTKCPCYSDCIDEGSRQSAHAMAFLNALMLL
jgi:hypothetical protein